MGIYRRYFNVPENSPVGERMKEINRSRKQYFTALEELQEEYLADSVHCYNKTGKFAGFKFQESKRDNTLFCKPKKEGLVTPRLGSKGGKEIAKRIAELPQPEALSEIFTSSGLGHGEMLMFSGMRMYNASLGFVEEPFTLIVSVPWKDVDPSDLEEYRRAKASGGRSERDLSHLLWEVPEGWEEVKEWQANKLLEEAQAKKS